MAGKPNTAPKHTTADTTVEKTQQTHPTYAKKAEDKANAGLPTVSVGHGKHKRDVPHVTKPTKVRTARPAYYGREPGTEQLYPAGSVIPDFVGPLGKGMTIISGKDTAADDED